MSQHSDRCSTPFTDLVGVRHPVVQTGMGWVSGPRLVTGTANAGGLGILASATMTFDGAREGDPRGQGAAPTSRSGSTCAPTPATRPTLRPADQARREGGVVRARAQARADQQAQGPRPGRDAVHRCRQARREGRRLGRATRRWCRAARRRPHRAGAHHAPAADRARRRRHPRRRGRRLLRRPRTSRGPVVPAPPRSAWAPASCSPRTPRSPTRSSSSTSTPTSPARSSPRRSMACRPDAAHARSSRRSRRPAPCAGSGPRSAGPGSSSRRAGWAGPQLARDGCAMLQGARAGPGPDARAANTPTLLKAGLVDGDTGAGSSPRARSSA